MRYEIGNICLDTSGHRLCAACGSEIPLAPKEFETLRLLAERAGEAIPKDDIIKVIWPGTFVGDNSLAKVISNLRKHLGADAIQTVPKVGYRLALPVKLVPNGLPKPEMVPQPVPVSVETANHRRRASDAPNWQPATPIPVSMPLPPPTDCGGKVVTSRLNCQTMLEPSELDQFPVSRPVRATAGAAAWTRLVGR